MDAGAEKFYAVRAGKTPGVYMTWPECQEQTAGFKGASYKSFPSREDAEAFVAGKNPPSMATDGTKQEKFYAIAIGKEPGIYTDWDTASVAIKGWKGPKYKKFDTRAEAVEYIRAHGDEAGQKSIAGEVLEPVSKKAKSKSGTDELEIEDDPSILHIYTDGSSLLNGRAGAAAGVGVWFGEGDPRNVSERLTGEPQTNQRAELTAVLRALQKVSVDQDIRIFSDSKYSISCVTEWYVNWKKNGWNTKEGPVKNKDLVEAIRSKIDDRDASGSKTLFQWVKGHKDTWGNVAADQLAVDGAKKK